MKLVVIGATGFLGSRTAAHFSRNHSVFLPDRRELDITSRAGVEAYLERIRPDGVIQCAAVSDVGACEKDPDRSWQINVTGSENVAAVCRKLEAKCILCSSDQVYFGSPVREPHREEEPLQPGNVYGREKLAMEQSCLRENPDSVLLRLSWMYDARKRQPGEHGNFLLTLLENIRAGKIPEFPVYDRRGITDVNLVTENLDRALELPGGVYNFGSGNDRSTYDMMEQILAELGFAGTIRKNTAAFAAAPRNLCMDQGKAAAMGIWFPPTEEALKGILGEVLSK